MSAGALAASERAPRAHEERTHVARERLAEIAQLYPFRSRWLDVPAGAYHYLDEGPGEAEPILCVHGNPTWSFAWRRVVLAFRRTRRVVVPDHVGCGLSDKPAGWSYRLESHIENLERLALALDLKRITLAVHDWGGPIGLGFAVRHPERVARLLILNTAAFPGGRIPWRIRVCRTPLLGALLVRRLNAFAGLLPVFGTERNLDPLVRRGYGLPYGTSEERVALHRFVLDIPDGPRHPSYAALAAIDAGLARLADRPAAIVWGERDWCFTPRFLAEWQRRLPRAAVRRVADAGHLVLEDAPEEVEAALRELLAAPAP